MGQKSCNEANFKKLDQELQQNTKSIKMLKALAQMSNSHAALKVELAKTLTTVSKQKITTNL